MTVKQALNVVVNYQLGYAVVGDKLYRLIQTGMFRASIDKQYKAAKAIVDAN